MRKYYEIALSSKDRNLTAVANYNLNDVDIRDFWHAKKVNETLASGMDFFISEGNIEETDYMANPLSLLIFSKRLLDILLPFIKDDVQIFDAPLYKKETMEAVTGFYIIHPFKEFECIDKEKTKHTYTKIGKKTFIPIGQLFISTKQIPGEIHIFRAREHNNAKIVTDSVVKLFIRNKIKSVVFYECMLA